jgi:hypothetical protein
MFWHKHIDKKLLEFGGVPGRADSPPAWLKKLNKKYK